MKNTNENWTHLVRECYGKKAVSIRLDEDILEFFKEGGKGYQTRMNATLRAYMEAVQMRGEEK